MENLKEIPAIQASEYNTQYMGVMLISVVVVAAVVLSTALTLAMEQTRSENRIEYLMTLAAPVSLGCAGSADSTLFRSGYVSKSK